MLVFLKKYDIKYTILYLYIHEKNYLAVEGLKKSKLEGILKPLQSPHPF